MSDRSVYLLKEAGMRHRAEIRSMIEGSGLRIVRSGIVITPEWVIRAIYPHLRPGRLGILIARMAGAEAELGVVEGADALSKLVELSGAAADPLRCPPGTIRGRFNAPIPGGAWPHHDNVIHRPRTTAELRRDLAIAGILLP